MFEEIRRDNRVCKGTRARYLPIGSICRKNPKESPGRATGREGGRKYRVRYLGGSRSGGSALGRRRPRRKNR